MNNCHNRMKYPSITIALLISLIAASRLMAAGSNCDGPSKLIDVTVNRLSTTPPTYIFSIRNNYRYPIINLSMGVSDHKELRIFPDNIPASIDSPEGWSGQHIFFEDGEYMKVFWRPKDNRFDIAPGALLSGFKLIMPQPVKREKQLYFSDGIELTPSV